MFTVPFVMWSDLLGWAGGPNWGWGVREVGIRFGNSGFICARVCPTRNLTAFISGAKQSLTLGGCMHAS
jgi:hypothetical protein